MVRASFHLFSYILGRPRSVQVLLPRPQSPLADRAAAARLGEKKTLWFFHGVGDDAEAVLLQTQIAALCDALDLIVILPDTDNSFCLDTAEEQLARRYLTEELAPYLRAVLGLSAAREQNLIGGISMGGYGACSLALEHPERFSRVACLSGALDLKAAVRYARACGIPLAASLTAEPEREERDLISMLDRAAAEKQPLPEFFLICSELDMVYRSNARFAARAAELGLSARLKTAPGLHDWSFWREHLPEALEWAAGGASALASAHLPGLRETPGAPRGREPVPPTVPPPASGGEERKPGEAQT